MEKVLAQGVLAQVVEIIKRRVTCDPVYGLLGVERAAEEIILIVGSDD